MFMRPFCDTATTKQFDLNEETGWPLFSDFICETGFNGHVVTNLPDGISERAILYFQRLERLADSYDFEIKVLFVINTLPDGLHLFDKLSGSFKKNVFPVKKIYALVPPSEFGHFDQTFGAKYADQTILFPRMAFKIMMLVRESSMPFQEFFRTNRRCAHQLYLCKTHCCGLARQHV
ncbi:hypothetical protein ACFS07_36685 [Undibacterium arcticum]